MTTDAKASGTGAKTIRRALLSVTDKTGLVSLPALAGAGVELISTGGTAKALSLSAGS